ncbi:hypothetical protein FNF29_06279 [Cafeteria roenbergensis]|uniref:Glucose-6-phosphate 1-dehydrogenase n=1 Tax=Cafeteria roenbergensis TaxID=33653 RepID=A0A5A8D3N4_CAFRO|nr:hypothetical protein FNF29_06279 [Cafeteria roenbergensis]KAA0160073.1 hypothetical protein FNF31_04531 [Cafeteria roenbergensis]|eukprot:KAA0148987.1 hypothetical protein FNF29_06279 [Cafeteria roenbergensis]
MLSATARHLAAPFPARPGPGSMAAGRNPFQGGDVMSSKDSFSIVVFGASGDLAKKKTYPAIFELFSQGLLPSRMRIMGYARSSKTDEDFRESLRVYIKSSDSARVEAFLAMCYYRNGSGYDDEEGFATAIAEMHELEQADGPVAANRVFYLALPPTVFSKAGAVIKAKGMSESGWNRVVVEKPFGKDSASSAKLSATLAKHFTEDQIYRIDHYLGKEMVQNLMVMRFGNAVFEPIWNRHYVKMVTITFKEPFGIASRAGYFDQYGIIRDIMQNHLTQVMSIVAMEPPVSLSAEDVRDEKVKVLRSVVPVREEDTVTGQYRGDSDHNAYLEEEGVPEGSTTPTFATTVVFIQNQRWNGVPFILKCGKGLNERKAEVRVQFRDAPHFLYAGGARGQVHAVKQTPLDQGTAARSRAPSGASAGGVAAAAAGSGAVAGAGACSVASTGGAHSVDDDGRGFDGGWHCAAASGPSNELVIRIQPEAAVYLKVMSKMPGLDNVISSSELNLSFDDRFPLRKSPEAYARLILDVMRGDQSQFVRSDELAAAWAIFTPLLHRLEGGPGYEALGPKAPVLYRFGSRGPVEADLLLNGYGFTYDRSYARSWRRQMEGPTMREFRSAFKLPTSELEALVSTFQREMIKGLAGGSQKSTIAQIYTHLDDSLTGRETGDFWGLDIGGTNLRLVRYRVEPGASPVRTPLRGPGCDEEWVFKAAIPPEIKKAPGAELFAWMAECCQTAGVKSADSIGFCFSFPYLQTALNRGFLLYWTKEFSNSGVGLDELPAGADEDAVAAREVSGSLENALSKLGIGASVSAIINDTVGTLMSGLSTDRDTKVGLILGTGTNACYVERKAAIPKLPAGVPAEGDAVVCMEWGAFGSSSDVSKVPTGAERLLPLTESDAAMLLETDKAGRQVFEKLISGKYLGAIARTALVQLFNAGEIFSECREAAEKSALIAPVGKAATASAAAAASADCPAPAECAKGDEEDSHGPLSTRMLFACVKDESSASMATRDVLRSLGIPSASEDDIYLVQEVCTTVAQRAARLVGMALAAVLRHTGHHDGVAGRPCKTPVVAIDGSLFSKNHDFWVSAGPEGFKSWVLEALYELGVRAELSPIENASFEGAAVVAAIAARRIAEGATKQSVAEAAAECVRQRSA